MADRRSLVEGLKAPVVDPVKEKAFVYGQKPAEPPAVPATRPADPLRRVALSTRIRGDFAEALKRASLERQLHGQLPNTLQDILEQAIEPWLKSNGYLT